MKLDLKILLSSPKKKTRPGKDNLGILQEKQRSYEFWKERSLEELKKESSGSDNTNTPK